MCGGHDAEAGATGCAPVLVVAGTLVPSIGGISAASAVATVEAAVLAGAGAAGELVLLARETLRRNVHTGATGAGCGPGGAP